MKENDLNNQLTEIDKTLKKRQEEYPDRGKSYNLLCKQLIDLSEGIREYSRYQQITPRPDIIDVCDQFVQQPVFICGAMKSGTTLILNLLDNHTDIFALPGDSHFASSFDKWNNDDFSTIMDYWIHRLINPTGKEPFWFLGPDLSSLETFSKYLYYFLKETPYNVLESIAMAVYVANEFPNNLPPKKLWIEKTPGNELYFPFLKKTFPKARFIHIIRDPLENLVSLQKLTGIRNWSASIEEHALKMKRHFKIAKNNYERNTDIYCIVKYENLISNPETTLKDICKFLHIEFEENLLTPTENGVPATSNSMFKKSRVQGKILDQSQKTRYKKYLDESTTLNIISLIQKEANYFDYEWELDGIESNQLSWQETLFRKIYVTSNIYRNKIKRFVKKV